MTDMAPEGLPKFTVVIPLYNGREYILRSVTSVLSQSYTNYEIVVVDDGSVDNGGDIMLECEDPRLRLVRQENRGVCVARNRGIAEGKGEYIAFLDADDEWYPNHLETLVSLINEYGEGGIYSTGYRMSYEVGSSSVEVFVDSGGESYSVVRDPFRLWCIRQVNNSSNSAVRKDILHEVGLYKEGEDAGEDLDLWIRICARRPLVISPVVTSIFHQTGTTGKARFDNLIQYSLPVISAGRFLQGEQEGLAINPRSVRKYIRRHVGDVFWSYISLDVREPLKTALGNSDVKTLAPVYYWLAHAPLIWPLLRVSALMYRLLHSRLALRLRGGTKRKRGVVTRLVKHRTTS